VGRCSLWWLRHPAGGLTLSLVWVVGWVVSFKAARANLFIEPTDIAVRAAARSVGHGIAGALAMTGTTLMEGALTTEVFWFIPAVIGAGTALLFVREPRSHGQPFFVPVPHRVRFPACGHGPSREVETETVRWVTTSGSCAPEESCASGCPAARTDVSDSSLESSPAVTVVCGFA